MALRVHVQRLCRANDIGGEQRFAPRRLVTRTLLTADLRSGGKLSVEGFVEHRVSAIGECSGG